MGTDLVCPEPNGPPPHNPTGRTVLPDPDLTSRTVWPNADVPVIQGVLAAGPTEPPSASDLGSGTQLSPDPEAVAAWDSALGRFSSLATLEYTIDSALLGPDGSGVRTVRTTSVDHDRGIARVHALMSADDGSAVPQEFEINTVMTPDSVLLQVPGWVTTMPEMEGKWLELTPDRMDEAGLPPGVGVLDIGDHFPPLELLEFAPVSMEQTDGSLVLAGSLSAPEALSLLGAGSYLTQNPEAALSMRGTVAAEARVDDAGFLRSLTLQTGEHHRGRRRPNAR